MTLRGHFSGENQYMVPLRSRVISAVSPAVPSMCVSSSALPTLSRLLLNFHRLCRGLSDSDEDDDGDGDDESPGRAGHTKSSSAAAGGGSSRRARDSSDDDSDDSYESRRHRNRGSGDRDRDRDRRRSSRSRSRDRRDRSRSRDRNGRRRGRSRSRSRSRSPGRGVASSRGSRDGELIVIVYCVSSVRWVDGSCGGLVVRWISRCLASWVGALCRYLLNLACDERLHGIG